MPKKTNPPEDMDAQGLYPIRTLSSLTGVNSITLRAWERRYGLIKPIRTPKGHRLYTQNDIDLIQQILALLEKGISIGQVSHYLESAEAKAKPQKKSDPWAVYQGRMINAIVRFDANALDDVYNDALALYNIDVVTNRMILPLLKTLGDRWESSEGSVAEEHFFGTYLRNKLGARFHHQPFHNSNGIKLVTACLPGEQHEVGLMLFCLEALNHDYQVIYLGANTPLLDIVEPVERTHAQAVILSSSIDPMPEILNKQLPQLSKSLSVPVYLGGKTAVKFHDALMHANITPLGDNISFALKRLDEELIA